MGALNDAVDTQRTYIVRTYMAVKRHTSCSVDRTWYDHAAHQRYFLYGSGQREVHHMYMLYM